MLRTLHNFRFLVTGTLLLSASIMTSFADDQADIKAEADFAAGLVDLRFPDKAKDVVDKLAAKYGNAGKAEVSRVRIKIMTSTGDFKSAKEEVGRMTSNTVENMAMRLTLADQLYNWGKLGESRELYDAFFRTYPTGPPPELQRFYSESAYKYAQMLQRVGDYTNAIQAYRYVLLSKLEPEDLVYQVKIEMCELIVRAAPKFSPEGQKKLLDEAFKIASDVQWVGQTSLWYWKSVVIMAHIEMIRGNKESARKIIVSKMEGLEDADKLLGGQGKDSLKHSPLAECRYLMGTMSEENGREALDKNSVADAKKAFVDALWHYFVVVKKYPSSSWAMEARKRLDGITKIAKERQWPIKLPAIDNSQFAAEQLRDARLQFSNGDFPAAAEKYKEVLGIYYDRQDMVAAIGELARCYIETEITEKQYPYFSRAVVGYVADRYCKSTNLYNEAGDTLLLVANAFETRGDRESSQLVLDSFFDKYSNHRRAVGAVLQRASYALKATNYVGALKYYEMISEKYTNSARAVEALGLTAWIYAKLGDHTNAITWYSNYVVKSTWSIEQAAAIRSLGDEYLQIGRHVPALNEYNRLAYFLTNRGDRIEMTPENQLRKKELLEWSLYQKGSCYARLKEPQTRVAYYQTNAINAYKECVKLFPKSERVPPMLGSMAILLSVQGRQQEADEMFQKLHDDWPTNEYSMNIVFVEVENLLMLGRTNEAIKAASRMLAKPEAFKPEQFYKIAGLMLGVSKYEEASKAYAATRLTTNSNMWQLASIGLGKALFGLGNIDEARKPLEEVLAKNRRSAYTAEVNLLLSRIYAELGKKESDPVKRIDCFNKSIKAMNIYRKMINKEDKKEILDAELELGAIQLLKDDKSAAAATYQRIFLFGDSADPRQRSAMESAFELGTPLLKELEKYDAVKENCQNYKKQFPDSRASGRAKDWEAWADARLGSMPQAKQP
ncbi:MAG: tetratricopeptide repeat protein [bacterium]